MTSTDESFVQIGERNGRKIGWVETRNVRPGDRVASARRGLETVLDVVTLDSDERSIPWGYEGEQTRVRFRSGDAFTAPANARILVQRSEA